MAKGSNWRQKALTLGLLWDKFEMASRILVAPDYLLLGPQLTPGIVHLWDTTVASERVYDHVLELVFPTPTDHYPFGIAVDPDN